MSIKNVELQIILIKNRISLLESRANSANGNIIKKLKRTLRRLEAVSACQ